MSTYLTPAEKEQHILRRPMRGHPADPHIHFCPECGRYWRHTERCVVFEILRCFECEKELEP